MLSGARSGPYTRLHELEVLDTAKTTGEPDQRSHRKSRDISTSATYNGERDLQTGVTESQINSKPIQVAQRQIHWWTPSLLAISFLGGVFAAISQHCLYSFLHGRVEDKENMKTSLVLCGRAMAYLSKIAFAQCIILCYNQRIWRTFSNHSLSVRSIDHIFSGTSDVSLLVDLEALMKAPLVAGMAMIVWLLPLATIIASPSALSFGWRPEDGVASVYVPVLNFSAESDKDWRMPIKMSNGDSKRSMSFYNTTNMAGTKSGWFDYYDKPSFDTESLLWRNVFSQPRELLNATFNQEIARLSSCGGNYNCTYSVIFNGPGYKCEDVTNRPGALFNTSILVPDGKYVYYADVDIGDYEQGQIPYVQRGPGGVPAGDTPDHAGDLRFEPELWIGYAYSTSEQLPPDSPYATNWTHKYEQRIDRCIHYETRYTVHFNFTGQTCLINSSSEYLAPILGYNFSQPNTGILPEPDWLSPRNNTRIYKRTAAYHALGQVFRDVIRGKIEAFGPRPGPSYTMAYSDITKTRLVGQNRQPLRNITAKLQEYYGEIVLTLLTQPQMIVTTQQQVLVHRSRHQIAFNYDPVRLWACYGPVIFITLAIMLFGLWTIWEDGTTFSSGFSRILATTRNPTLDKLSKGICLGNDPFPLDFMRQKIRFGALQNDDERLKGDVDEDGIVGHCAFGMPGEVTRIRKEALYAGLDTARHSTKPSKAKCD